MEYREVPRAAAVVTGRDRENTARMLVLVILGIEMIFFGTLVSAYLYLNTSPGPIRFSTSTLQEFVLPLWNTLVLLVSAGLVYRSVSAARQGKQKSLQVNLSAALAAGLLFVAGQIIEFYRLGWAPGGSISGDAYFALVAFHALHVLAGVVVLGFMIFKANLGDIQPEKTDALQAGSWFWYFVVFVWLVLFAVLFLW